MRSTPEPSDDLTAKARIREAAIRLFAKQGARGTSVRQIAAAAGVSAALVIHHFGGKDELRRACDDHVIAVLRDPSGAVATESLPAEGEYGRYLARLVTEGSNSGNELFDRLVAETATMIDESIAAGRMRETDDRSALALVLVCHSLAPLLLSEQLARVRDEAELSTATLRSIARPTADIYTRGLFTTDDLLNAVTQEATP